MGLGRWIRDQRDRPTGLPNFDSSTTLVRALANCLRGTDFPVLGLAPRQVLPAVAATNRLPKPVRARLFRLGSASEATDPDNLASIDFDEIRAWVTNRYPRRGYPAVVVGSASGALIHLAALLGIPWLPQTFLVPVRRNIDPDDPRADLEWAREPAQRLLSANGDVEIHQLNDPNQDRAPLPRMAYFRVKLLELGAPYQEFLRTVLAPGGTVLVSECTLRWPTTHVADRHSFQFGCIGGLEPGAYHENSDRVARFLADQGSTHRQWDPPAPDAERCDAEWGFASPLREDVKAFSHAHGCRVRRLEYEHPRALSPIVAALYEDTYERHGVATTRLLVDTFAQLDPWWTLRTGSIPFWLSFTADADVTALETYLDARPHPYEELYLTMFSHGVESIGLADGARWDSIRSRASCRGRFVGTDPDEFPFDFASVARFNAEIPRAIPARQPLVPPPSIGRFERFVADHAGHGVRLLGP